MPTSVGPSGPLAQLFSFIPTETLSVYLAIETALGVAVAPKGQPVCKADFEARWLWVLALAIATIALTWALSYRKQKQASQTDPFRFPIVEVAAATSGFLIWALSLPSTPLRDFCGYDPSSWSPVILLGGTIVIATMIYVSGKTVAWTKVLTDEVPPNS
ncbi:hypothetical protein [Streptomyces sp. C10-9-1]|uniref:hypothetical protein n=1 Tax=Streptomyces sp. C10-9-1 TaxID=1859285 RepID=UPI003D75BD19